MSTFWEIYTERVAEGAVKLEPLPKEIPQHILWLKAYVAEKLKNNKGIEERYVGSSDNGTFGFKETYVNYLMHYAYEAGLKCREIDYEKKTSEMNNGLNKIKDILEELGYVDDNYDN